MKRAERIAAAGGRGGGAADAVSLVSRLRTKRSGESLRDLPAPVGDHERVNQPAPKYQGGMVSQ